jgi:hypothetical protein
MRDSSPVVFVTEGLCTFWVDSFKKPIEFSGSTKSTLL